MHYLIVAKVELKKKNDRTLYSHRRSEGENQNFGLNLEGKF